MLHNEGGKGKDNPADNESGGKPVASREQPADHARGTYNPDAASQPADRPGAETGTASQVPTDSPQP